MMGLFRKNQCEATREQLSVYLDGRLSPEEQQLVERHLASCERCRQELSQLRATVDLLHGLPRALPRRSFTLSEELARLRHPVTWWQPVLRSATAVAAILLSMVLIGDFLQVSAPGMETQKALAPEKGLVREVTAVADQSKLRAAAPAPAAAPEAAPRAPLPLGTPAPQPPVSDGAAAVAPPTAPAPSPAPKAAAAAEGRPSPAPASVLPFRQVEIGLFVLVLVLGGAALIHWRLAKGRMRNAE
ncbi:MAG: zf-HC2 domain-containing protein [Chloroflexi bacterium]|nr:zf-HC2 domain-containing protein [Chloroflexota bacterium]